MDLFLFEPDGSTLVDIIPDVLDASFLDEAGGLGGGSLTIHEDNPVASSLSSRSVIRVRIGGIDVGGWIVKTIKRNLVGGGVDGDRTITASGPGVTAWLEDALIYQKGMTSASSGTRTFSWVNAPGLDTANWRTPMLTEKAGSASSYALGWPFRNRDEGVTVVPTWWPNSGATSAAGVACFRATVTITEANAGKVHSVWYTGSQAVQVWWDGEPIGSASGDRIWRNLYAAQATDTTAGAHTLAFSVQVLADGQYGALAFTCSHEERDWISGNITAGRGWWTLFADAEWFSSRVGPADQFSSLECLPFVSIPGWTPGQILDTLIDEAVTRGVTSLDRGRGFADATDTDGTDWTEIPFKASVGTSVWDTCEKLADLGVDVAIRPDPADTSGWLIDAWQDRGTDLTGSVLIDAGAHVTDADTSEQWAIANVLLLDVNGRWVGATDAASIERYGRIEAKANLSTFGGSSSADVAGALLARSAIPAEAVKVAFTPVQGNLPWEDFGVGDTVSVALGNGRVSGREVKSISVSLAAAGTPEYTVEFDSIWRDAIEQLDTLISDPLGSLMTVPTSDTLAAVAESNNASSGETVGDDPDPEEQPGGGDQAVIEPTPSILPADQVAGGDDPLGPISDECCQPPGGSVSGGGGDNTASDDALEDGAAEIPNPATVTVSTTTDLSGELDAGLYGFSRRTIDLNQSGGTLTNALSFSFSMSAQQVYDARYLLLLDGDDNVIGYGNFTHGLGADPGLLDPATACAAGWAAGEITFTVGG